jgi:hypothetical protein
VYSDWWYSSPAIGETIAVTGVAIDEQGRRAKEATAYLCYAKANKSGVASDITSSNGVFALVRENVLEDLKTIFVVILGDATHLDSVGEVTLSKTPDKLLIGKAQDVVWRDRPPTSVSFRLTSKGEAIAMLRDLEVAKTLLVRNGIKKRKEVEESYTREAAQILANVRDREYDPLKLLPEVKAGVEAALKDKSEIDDQLRAYVPQSDGFKMLRGAEFDFRAHLAPGEKLPDEVLRTLIRLPEDAIEPEAITKLLEGRIDKAMKARKLIGVLRTGQTGSDPVAPASLFTLNPTVDVETNATDLLKKHPEVKKSVLIDELKEHASNQEQKELLGRAQVPAELRFLEAKEL